MSFLSKQSICNQQPKFDKTSLQAYYKIVFHNSRNLKFPRSKRMSSFLLSTMEGSMTVEASIAIPLFLFAILNLLSIILFFGEFSSNLADMHQRAKMLSVHAHVQEMGQEVGNDLIIQTKVQKMEPIISVMGFIPARTIVNCRVRKWTGYDVTGADPLEEVEEWVYITPHGERYHRSRDCRHLRVKIYSASTEKIVDYRNDSGEKYRRCESCGDDGLTGICFYTEYGNRYHATLQCSGLKRSVQTVRISEVGRRHVCAYCGEKEE